MKTLSIRQPYAWLIIAGIKPIENRTWQTHYRGLLQIHASKRPDDIDEIERRYRLKIDREALQFGGIIGRVILADIVTHSTSRWFTGPFGWVFEQPRAVRFTPFAGLQSLFDAPEIR